MNEKEKDPLSKVFVLDVTRPQYLNVSVRPSIGLVDLHNKEFSDTLVQKTRAVSIYVDERAYAEQKGWQRYDHRGGDFVQYFDQGKEVDALSEMSEDFSRKLDERGLPHVLGWDFRVVDGNVERGPDLEDQFWLKKRLTMSEIESICQIPYVAELNLFVEYNQGPEVQAWIEDN